MSNDYIPLLSLFTFTAALSSLCVFAHYASREDRERHVRAEQERIRKSEEDLIREVWGPAGKPKKPTVEPESRSRSAE